MCFHHFPPSATPDKNITTAAAAAAAAVVRSSYTYLFVSRSLGFYYVSAVYRFPEARRSS